MDEKTLAWTDLHQSVATGASEPSFLSSAADWISQGVPVAVASGFVSMYNTGVSLGNVLGADAEKIDLGAELASFDDSLANYYKEHKEGADLGGFLATSLIPGVGGIKALKMLQGGVAGVNAERATGLLKNTQGLFGFFRNKEAMFTERALAKTRAISNDVFSAVDNDKLLAIAFGAGDQALQGAAFQTAVLLSMNQSPVLSKPDEDYFTSLLTNSHEILTAGGIQGAFGGVLGGIGIAGKIKKTIFARDVAELPSKSVKQLGVSDVDVGTGLAIDFSYLRDKTLEFERLKTEGGLTDRQINNYQNTIKNQTADIRLRLTEQLIGKEDAALNDGIWELIHKTESPEETASLILSMASRIDRVTVGPEEIPALKVMFGEGLLPARKAANILARGKIAPDIFSSEVPFFRSAAFKETDGTVHETGSIHDYGKLPKDLNEESTRRYFTDKKAFRTHLEDGFVDQEGKFYTREEAATALKQQQKLPPLVAGELHSGTGMKFGNSEITDELLLEWRTQGYELYKDSGGTLHVIEGTPYAKGELAKGGLDKKNPSLVIKLVGDQQGRITEEAHPVVGDLGPVSLSKAGDLMVGDARYPLPEGGFNPLVNDPLTSNAQFVHVALSKLSPEAVEDGVIHVAKGDIPTLEMLAKEGFNGEIFYGGQPVEYDLPDVLAQAKLELRQVLINASHPFDRIARELNVTREFAETGRGEGYMLSALEDHTKPLHAKICYETSLLPDNFVIRGIESLRQRVELAGSMNQKVSASVLGKFYGQLVSTKGTLFNISTIPNLAGPVTFASEDFGSFGFAMQQSGKVLDMAHRERTQAIFQSLQGYRAQIESNPEALIEANWVANKIRSVDSPHTILEEPENLGKKLLVPKSVLAEATKEGNSLEGLITAGLANKSIVRIREKVVGDFWQEHMRITGERASGWNQIFAAKGSAKTYDVDVLYVQPINTKKYPYVNFVKEKMDIGPGHFNEAGVLVAPTREALEAKVNQIRAQHGDRFEVFSPSDIETYRKIQGEYENTPFLGSSYADSALRKEGLLYEFQPRVDNEIFNDIFQWHWAQEKILLKQAVELKYSQEFAEVRAMGKQYASFAENKFGPTDARADAKKNPYYRYIATGLNESSFDPNSLFGKFNGMVEGIGQKMFSAWDTMRERATRGEIDWETANRQAESYGFTAPYKGIVNAALEEVVQPRIENLRNVQGLVAKANGAVATLTLGFDFLNSVLNVMSFPILGISEMSNILRNIRDPNIVGQLAELTSVQLPGAQLAIPSPMKLLTNSIARLFGENKKELAQYYQDIGAIRSNSQLYVELAEASSLTEAARSSPEGLKTWTENLHEKAVKITEVGKTVTGYNKAEFMVRFLAADMMKQITDLAGIAAEDAPAYINSFVNRVHGNYLANQRPHLFQGAVGQAISLFQTYQFNIMQNMVRYIETGNKTTAATLLGLQNTIFGLQGNPAFYLLNQAIGNSNREHVDIVNSAQTILGSETSKWVLYGLGANAIQTSLYNRGDLTPRYATIVPTDPAEIPGIAIPVKAISAFVQTASNIAKGGDVSNSLLDGIAHFGANRPLSGLAQLTQGYRTSSKGDLLTAYSDLDGFAVAAKIAGGEELNRAIALDAYHRNMAYKADDKEKIGSIGEALKTTMYKGQNPTEEQVVSFMKDYTNAGGTPLGFNRFMQTSFRNANTSQMNLLAKHVKSRAGRMQARSMGADETPDFFNREGLAEE